MKKIKAQEEKTILFAGFVFLRSFMKFVTLGLFLAHLIFLCVKSFQTSVNTQEVFLSLFLFLIVAGQHLLTFGYKSLLRFYRLKKEELEIKRLSLIPPEEDEEIAKMKKETLKKELELKKFLTEQEFSKREITRAFEQNGGLRF